MIEMGSSIYIKMYCYIVLAFLFPIPVYLLRWWDITISLLWFVIIITLLYCYSQPQNSFPDVVISMISGSKRIAYYRIPANEVLFSKNSTAKGKDCAKLQNVIMKVSDIRIACFINSVKSFCTMLQTYLKIQKMAFTTQNSFLFKCILFFINKFNNDKKNIMWVYEKEIGQYG